ASMLAKSSNSTQNLSDTIAYNNNNNLSSAVSHDLFTDNLSNTKLVNRFEAMAEDTINKMVEYGAIKNTKKNTDNWVRVLKEYRFLVNLNYDITTILEMTQLEHELIQFFLGLRCKDIKLYSPKSIYNCYCTIACYLKDNSLIYPRPNLFDETCYGILLKSLDGKIKKIQNLNPRSANKSDSLSFEEVCYILNHDELFYKGDAQWLKITYITVTKYQKIQVIIPREKNNAGGIKNLDNAGRKCEIPPDQNGKFTPVVDILYYMNKHPSGFLVQEFFLQIVSKKDRIMPFSGHRTLNSIILYQTFTSQVMHNTVSLIILYCDSSETLSKNTSQVNSDNKENHSKEFLDSKEEYDKRIPLASLLSNTESNIHKPKKKRKVSKPLHNWSKPFKVLYHTSSNQTSPELQKSYNKDSDKSLNNCSIPQTNINNSKNISVKIMIKHS
ncbi:24435_t:CDS:2, partial [Gigaspora margarita]